MAQPIRGVCVVTGASMVGTLLFALGLARRVQPGRRALFFARPPKRKTGRPEGWPVLFSVDLG